MQCVTQYFRVFLKMSLSSFCAFCRISRTWWGRWEKWPLWMHTGPRRMRGKITQDVRIRQCSDCYVIVMQLSWFVLQGGGVFFTQWYEECPWQAGWNRSEWTQTQAVRGSQEGVCTRQSHVDCKLQSSHRFSFGGGGVKINVKNWLEVVLQISVSNTIVCSLNS